MSTNVIVPKAGAVKAEPRVVKFEKYTTQKTTSLSLSVEGDYKTGKTNFAFTAPGPIAYFAFDRGHKGVIEKFCETKDIYPFEYDLALPSALPTSADGAAFTVGGRAAEVWKEFVLDLRAAIANPDIKTIVRDTATEEWELLRIARFGKILQIPQIQYSTVNFEYRELTRIAEMSGKNNVYLSKVKTKYENNQATDKKERAGWGDLGFAVQATLKTFTQKVKGKPDEFRMRFLDVRHDPTLNGSELVGEEVNFANVASKITGTKMEEWL